jgi:hypothetical protein
VICTKRVVNDRLLMFLLRHLKPERYGADALALPAPPPEPVEAVLSALEPRLPAPPEQLLDAQELDAALELADAADGILPQFLSEQRPPKSPERIAREARAQQERSGEAAWDKAERGGTLDAREFADMCRFIDPAGRADPPRRRYR